MGKHFPGFQEHGKWVKADMNIFRKKSSHSLDVSSLNQISCYETVKPVYAQDLKKKRTIEFAYADTKVIIIGSMDGNYPYWVSETEIDDIETNAAIAESILHEEYSSFTQTGKGLYSKLNDLYRRGIYCFGDDVKTPFGHGYAKEQPENWGWFIARDIYHYHIRLKEMCKVRELDGRYLEFLQAYLKRLEAETFPDPVKDYESKKILMDLVRSEDYLLLSGNREIRDTYIAIRNVISNLYNAYMSIVR